MAPITCFVFLVVLSLCSCEDCVLDNSTPDLQWEVQLVKNLKKCNKDYLPPVQGKDAEVNVTVRFILRRFDLDNDDVFTTYSWVILKWYDGRLTWKPEDYGGIDDVVVSTHAIWTPAFKLHNSINPDEIDILLGRCTVENTGKVICACKILHQTVCSSNLRNWPFDTQTCTQKFGEKQQNFVKIQYNFKYASTIGSEYGPHWTIMDYKAENTPNETEQIALTLSFDREAHGLAISIVIPSIVVSVLTIISLVLSIDNTRLFISCLSMLLHYSILQEISSIIPKRSFDPPIILLFVRGSVIFTLLSVVLTCFLRYIDSTQRPIYAWAKSVNDFVYSTKYNCIIWPRWKKGASRLTISEDLSDDDSNRENWVDFASFINFVCIILYIILYSISFIVYMPKINEIKH